MRKREKTNQGTRRSEKASFISKNALFRTCKRYIPEGRKESSKKPGSEKNVNSNLAYKRTELRQTPNHPEDQQAEKEKPRRGQRFVEGENVSSGERIRAERSERATVEGGRAKRITCVEEGNILSRRLLLKKVKSVERPDVPLEKGLG